MQQHNDDIISKNCKISFKKIDGFYFTTIISIIKNYNMCEPDNKIQFLSLLSNKKIVFHVMLNDVDCCLSNCKYNT